MSERDVTEVLGPPWIRDTLAWFEIYYRHSERAILALRKLLRQHDPSLPDPYDGRAWSEIERPTL